MILIGESYCHVQTANLTADELKTYAVKVFEEFERSAATTLRLKDYELQLDIEEGSVKSHGGIFAAAAFLYAAVGHYGDFVHGVKEIASQARAVGDALNSSVPERLNAPKQNVIMKRRGAAKLGQLERLFESVAQGKLTPADATAQALQILEDDKAIPGTLQAEIREAMRKIKRHPEQMLLPEIDQLPEGMTDASQADSVPIRKRTPIQDKSIQEANRLRVEVRKKHKNGPTLVEIIEL